MYVFQCYLPLVSRRMGTQLLLVIVFFARGKVIISVKQAQLRWDLSINTRLLIDLTRELHYYILVANHRTSKDGEVCWEAATACLVSILRRDVLVLFSGVFKHSKQWLWPGTSAYVCDGRSHYYYGVYGQLLYSVLFHQLGVCKERQNVVRYSIEL